MQLSPKVYVFLQALTLLVGFVAFVFLMAFPLTEGRAVGLSLVKIYMDPFILYLYGAALVFYGGLYRIFLLLDQRKRQVWASLRTLQTLRQLQRAAVVLAVMILSAGLYIRFFHHPDDDPAGFLGLAIVLSSVSLGVARWASVSKNRITLP